jgi:hypothetical protein
VTQQTDRLNAALVLGAASVTTSPTFSVSAREVVFEGNYSVSGAWAHANFDVAPDGKSLLMLRPVMDNTDEIVIPNWKAELRAGGKGTGQP